MIPYVLFAHTDIAWFIYVNGKYITRSSSALRFDTHVYLYFLHLKRPCTFHNLLAWNKASA